MLHSGHLVVQRDNQVPRLLRPEIDQEIIDLAHLRAARRDHIPPVNVWISFAHVPALRLAERDETAARRRVRA
jgi:hypothetical protein